MPPARCHLPRLQRESYQGFATVHWTFCIQDRVTGWLDASFHARFREVLLHACFRHGCVIPTYCLMPDHWHVLMTGVREDSDLHLAARFLRKHLAPSLSVGTLQKQSYDHILRGEERERDAFAGVSHDILENPLRAGLSPTPAEYAYSGSQIPGYPDLSVHHPGYWDLYWRIHHRLTTAATPAHRHTHNRATPITAPRL